MNRHRFLVGFQNRPSGVRPGFFVLCLLVSFGVLACDYAPFDAVSCRFDDDCVAGALCVQRFCRFEDGPKALAEVVVEPKSLSLVIGETVLLEAKGYDADGRQVPGMVYWSAGDGEVVRVGDDGRLLALAAGSTTVRATLEADGQSKTGTIEVEVRCGGVNSVDVGALPASLEVGAEFQMTAVVLDGCQEQVEAPVLVWSVDNTSVATIDASTGVLTGKMMGSTQVTGTVDGVSGSVMISVVKSEITAIEIDLRGSSELSVGDQRLIAVTFYAGGQVVEIEGAAVVWYSEPASIVAVSAHASMATLTANAEGDARISARYVLDGGGELTAETDVTVAGVCAGILCNHRGECVDTSGSAICECDPGYAGASCEDCDSAGGYFADGSNDCVNPLSLGSNLLVPEVWLDAADATSIELELGSNAVVRWRDRTENGHDATPALSNLPEWVDSGSKRFLSFDATTLEVKSTMTVGTVFVVARYDAGDGQGFDEQSGLFSGKGGGGPSDSQRVYFTGEKDTLGWLHLRNDHHHRSRLTTKFVNGVEPMPNPHLIPTTDLREWMIFSGTDDVPVGHDHWLIGADREEQTFYWVGDVAEILIYEVALLQEDRKQIEGYLNEKWKIYSPSGGP